ncbi:hypothetical protein BH09MYX1_BH09MYX1_20250 [soil metagenome]
MRRLSPLVLGPLAMIVASCSGDTTTVDPGTLTSIVVRAASLTSGFGCGTGDAQVYKYAVYVTPPDPNVQLPVSSLSDCFADATFTGLTGASTGVTPFKLEIFAFRASDFQKDESAITTASSLGDSATLKAKASWQTTCTAAQQSSVTVLAVCQNPLR